MSLKMFTITFVDSKIFWVIVCAVFVDMMNHLFGSKEATQLPFHDKAMFIDIPPIIGTRMASGKDFDISVSGFYLASTVAWVIFAHIQRFLGNIVAFVRAVLTASPLWPSTMIRLNDCFMTNGALFSIHNSIPYEPAT